MTVSMRENRFTVNLVLVLHDQERVIVEVTEEFDIRLNSPVVLVLVQERVSEEVLDIEHK